MSNPTNHTPRWMELAEQASHEKDSNRLLSLVREVNRLLDEGASETALNPDKFSEPGRLASEGDEQKAD